MPQTEPGRTPRHESLAAYLDDHLLGAEAGVRLFKAAYKTWEDTEHEAVFAHLTEQISDERDELETLILALGYRRSPVKRGLAWIGAAVGRLGPVNPLSTGTGTTGQLELETLQSVVRAKECLWQTLLVLSAHDHRFHAPRIRELLEHARDQQGAVAKVMEDTAPARFLT
ncbi:hypothetical protein [Arthrobacter sp.]|uniref:hypothetical protein n=1 Tax=Arthrobacter sp. TaxID=1667 RepID=UPI0028A0A3C2|nr:hypothetical protein [Arthrobacter sp.]